MLRLVLPMVTIAGALMPAVSLFGLTALGWTSSRLIAVGTIAILGHGALALIPDVSSEGGKPLVELHQLLFGSLGLLTWGMILGVCRRLWRGDATDSSPVQGTLAADRFLVVWLVGEVAIYFLASPFPAARRILGVIVVVTLLVGRLAQRTCQSQRQMFWIRCIMAGGMALGFVYFAADWFDAQVAQQSATTAATEWQPAPGGTAWFADLHGFGFYAERAGLKPLALNRDRPRKGDILFAPVKPFCSINLVHLESHGFREVGQIKLADWFPLRTYVNYYSGRSPLVRVRGPRFVVNVFQFSPEIRSDTEQAGRPAAKADATDSSR